MRRFIAPAVLAAVLLLGPAAYAGTNANTWHNLPASNPANDGTSCGETGSTPLDSNCASANIHDVHDVDAAGFIQANGYPVACVFHGGFQGVKNNCPG